MIIVINTTVTLETITKSNLPFGQDLVQIREPDWKPLNYDTNQTIETPSRIQTYSESPGVVRVNLTREIRSDLYDPDKMIARASHGIHLLNQGEAYVFFDYFKQFLKIKILIPIKPEINKITRNWCKVFEPV